MDDAGNIRRIGLYGPFGWGNLGDASIQEAMIHNVRRRLPEAEFVGISLNPDNTEEIHGIRAVPILRSWRSRSTPVRSTGESTEAPSGGASLDGQPASFATGGIKARLKEVPVLYPMLKAIKARAEPALEVAREIRFLIRSYVVLRNVDLLIISGGGQLSDDWGGPWDHPYSLLAWMFCGRLAGARVLVVSVGAGPILSPASGVLIRSAIRLAHYRSYRDPESHAFLRASGVTLPASVYPDLAFSLPRHPDLNPRERGHKPVVGISPLCYFYPVKGAWPEQDNERYQQYMATMSGFAASVLDEGHPAVVFINQIKNDRYAYDDLLAALRERVDLGSDRLRAAPTEDLEHLLTQIAETDIVVTSRLHGVILSYLHHKAVISLSYDPKIDAVMRHFGQSEFCLDIDTCTLDLLQERFGALRSRLDAVTEQIRIKATENRTELQAQYDRLFGAPAGDGRRADVRVDHPGSS